MNHNKYYHTLLVIPYRVHFSDTLLCYTKSALRNVAFLVLQKALYLCKALNLSAHGDLLQTQQQHQQNIVHLMETQMIERL